MKITCNTAILNKAIQTAQRVISSKPSSPIFSGLRILTNTENIEIHAMDLNVAISCTVEAQVSEVGEIVVSAKHFAELIRKLPGEDTTITNQSGSNTIKIESGSADFNLFSMNPNDFPPFPIFNGDKAITIDDETIKELIKKTIFACSTDESRPVFTGILVEAENDTVTFVGTNTHRLAIKSKKLSAPVEKPLSMIIPAKVFGEIFRNLTGEAPQEVVISLLKNQLMVSINNIIIVSRLINGNFPNYKKVIPPKFATTTTVAMKDLAGAVERVAIFSTEGDYSTIKMSVSEENITITSSSPEVGTGKEVIPCSTSGSDINVAFNAKYILDILKNLEGDKAIISMNSPLNPVCITSAQEEDYTYIVTPVRVVF